MTASSRPSPPAPRLGWNRWDQLEVPELGDWTPTRPVTVVMPYYQAPDAIRLTLAALTRQTYPHELLQVVVVDDGSDPPLELPGDLDLGDLRVEVVHQEDRGFGLARARNTGAKAADGEILILLDCDMVPEPWHVEAHARWHHAAADVVVLGFRRHVEYDGIGTDDLLGVDATVGLEPLFVDRDVQVPTWIDKHMERTGDLTTTQDDLFRPVTGGNLSMRADTYWRAGGSDETFTQWGAEDTELGYRLFVDGDLLVPDRQARCWHQGHGHTPTEAEKASLDDQRAKLSHLIAHRGFRSRRPGRHFQVPRVLVRVEVEGAQDRDTVVATVESVLGGRFTDVVVVLVLDPDHPDSTWLQRQFEPDPSVRVFTEPVDLDEVSPHTPVLVEVPAGVTLGERTLDRVATLVESGEHPSGLLRATVPAHGPGAPTILLEAWLRRARRRAARAADEGESLEDAVTDLFGQRWVSADEVDMPVDEPPTTRERPDPEPLPEPHVGWNRWDQLEGVPELGQWTPTRPVTVVMPHYQAPDELAVTLAAFARQTYPMDLLQVVVVDDGSSPPLVLPDDLDLGDLRVTVLHQEDRGFGAPRARNLGAKEADGEILVFVDCDMVPEPWHVEAHARWHHTAADLAVLGFRQHVDFDGITPASIATMDAATGVASLVTGRDAQRPEWIEGHMLRTDELTSADRDLFRPVASGNLSVTARQFWRVGGFDESFTQWGGEDTELGYRLLVDGGVLVPDREAQCWHQGAGHEPSESEWVSLEDQRAKLAHLIADRGFRSSHPGRHFTVPRVVVRVPVGGDVGRDAVQATVESLLGSTFTDVLVVLQVEDDHADRTWLTRQFAPDPKVRVRGPGALGALDNEAQHAPIRGTVDAGIVLGDESMAALVAMLDNAEDPVGLLHVTVPGRSPEDPRGMVQLWLTRAHKRAYRLAAGQPLAPVVGELFGERWVAGTEVGIHDRGVDAPAPTAAPTSNATAAGLEEVADLWQVFRNLEPSERETIISSAKFGLEVLGPSQRRLAMKLGKRLMLIAVALKALLGARAPGDVARGVVQLAKAALPWSVYLAGRRLGQPVARRLRRPS